MQGAIEGEVSAGMRGGALEQLEHAHTTQKEQHLLGCPAFALHRVEKHLR